MFFNASWFCGFALLKASSLLDSSDNHLLIAIGMFFRMLGGWFDCEWTYLMVLLGFVNGAKLFLWRFSVTLRKFTSSRFALIVTFRPFS